MKVMVVIATGMLLMARTAGAQLRASADRTQAQRLEVGGMPDHSHEMPQDTTGKGPSDRMEHRHGMAHEMTMTGLYGPYRMTRETSGTAWQPEETPMEGIHSMRGPWMIMAHAFATAVYTDQGGPRGENGWYGPTMLMGMASLRAGPGTLGARAMLSLDPAAIGREGYPELLQTGETADGKRPLIDRQHPHELFMELAGSYSLPLGEAGSVFAYAAMPGEPALGPPTFMHRFSGLYNPEAPITHHWLDATHITFGVATMGATWRGLKLDGSIFTGREPDQRRWNFDRPRFDSYAARLSWNPNARWALQVSSGWIQGPEQLDPETDVVRTTASVMYAAGTDRWTWQSTLAWGRNAEDHGHALDGGLLESAVRRGAHVLFGRAESVEKDELFPPGDPRESTPYTVHKAAVGYLYTARLPHALRAGPLRALRAGIGGSAAIHFVPRALCPVYDDEPVSYLLFARLQI